MAVRIRLARRGRRNRVTYDMVVASSAAPRDGRFIEKIGTYNPLTNPASIALKEDRAFHWLMNGASPSDTVKAILSYRGMMLKKHLQIGVIKGALTQEQADAKLAEWLLSKEQKIQGKRDRLAEARQTANKTRKEAERKVKEARAEAARERAAAASQALEASAKEAAAQAAEAAGDTADPAGKKVENAEG